MLGATMLLGILGRAFAHDAAISAVEAFEDWISWIFWGITTYGMQGRVYSMPGSFEGITNIQSGTACT
eukprot:m.138737 g.138737  ORF g.138737 m.138737 type:complete len:68 (+) comp17595_c0_seq4:255-458(+)